jgi:hypothetical protein
MSNYFSPYTCTELEYKFFDICMKLERYLRRQDAGLELADYYDDNNISGSWLGINMWEQAVENYAELYPMYQKYIKLINNHIAHAIHLYVRNR